MENEAEGYRERNELQRRHSSNNQRRAMNLPHATERRIDDYFDRICQLGASLLPPDAPIPFIRFLFHPGMGAKYCDVRGLFVCLSARITQKPQHGPTLPLFCTCCPWPWIGPPLVALRYVLPVLCMTSHFHAMDLWRVVCFPKQRQNTTSTTNVISTKFCSTMKIRKYISTRVA